MLSCLLWLYGLIIEKASTRQIGKTEVMHKAIEAGAKIDADFFKGLQGYLTVKERLLRRLTSACVTSLLGLFMLVGGVFYGLGMGSSRRWTGREGSVG